METSGSGKAVIYDVHLTLAKIRIPAHGILDLERILEHLPNEAIPSIAPSAHSLGFLSEKLAGVAGQCDH